MKDCLAGLGFDVHSFSKEKKPLILGGVIIYHASGLEAVSDGDVVLHAVSDAICGSCGLGDIGDYFPPDSEESKDLDSKKIVNFILEKINGKYIINNIDVTIVAEKPKLVTYKKEIENSLKKILSISCVNIKVKSKEGLNILGGKDSIACLVMALVRKI